MSPKLVLARTRHFLETGLWSARLERADRGRAFLYRAGRAIYATGRSFQARELTARAASLTYYTVLSIVPFLAFAFSLLKGFGVYQRIMEQSVQPLIEARFGDNAALKRAIEQILSFVEHTSFSGLSVAGVLVLLYTSINMLSTIERAMNDIWEAPHARPLLRKVTDYTTLVVVGPLLVVAALALGAAIESSAIVNALHRWLPIDGVVDVLFGSASIVFGCAALVALYVIMPNVAVRFRSALLGGVVAGLLWRGVLLILVKLQIGVAKYNALYAGFAAIPIFLVWLYVEWMIVLVGAQLGASHQYERRLQQAVRARYVDQELEESLAVAVAAAVSRRFLEGRPPLTPAMLADALETPPPVVERVLEALVRSGILVRVVDGGQLGIVPGRDVDAVHMADVEEAVRLDPKARDMKDALERAVGAALTTLLRSRREGALKDSGSLTLRQLASQCRVEFEIVEVERRPAPRAEVLADGKLSVGGASPLPRILPFR